MLPKPKLLLRGVIKADSIDLWNWRNDKLTRSNSFKSKKISFKEHKRWFAKSLKNRARRIYVATKGTDKIGTIRLDFLNKKVIELSIMVNPDHRGKNFGKQMLKQLNDSVKEKYVNRIQKAIIKTPNVASEKTFSYAGFTKIHQTHKPAYSIWIRP